MSSADSLQPQLCWALSFEFLDKINFLVEIASAYTGTAPWQAVGRNVHLESNQEWHSGVVFFCLFWWEAITVAKLQRTGVTSSFTTATIPQT